MFVKIQHCIKMYYSTVYQGSVSRRFSSFPLQGFLAESHFVIRNKSAVVFSFQQFFLSLKACSVIVYPVTFFFFSHCTNLFPPSPLVPLA